MKKICKACLKSKNIISKNSICDSCKLFLEGQEGRDYVREKIRILRRHTCGKCGKKWHVGERRFDIHHLAGLCGKKSRGYDTIAERRRLRVLCRPCHVVTHGKSVANIGFSDKQKENMVEMRNEGMTYDAIARYFGVTQATIFRHVKRFPQMKISRATKV